MSCFVIEPGIGRGHDRAREADEGGGPSQVVQEATPLVEDVVEAAVARDVAENWRLMHDGPRYPSHGSVFRPTNERVESGAATENHSQDVDHQGPI